MPLRPDQLHGSWDLEAFVVELPGGTQTYPMGEGALGRLMYGSDGTMSATLSRGDRPLLSVPRLEAYAKAPDGEKAAAFDAYLAYVGRYELDGEDVVHHVELASVPNIVGMQQRRTASLEGNQLTLAYAVESSRGTRHYTLRWRRS
ncbi:MAG: lipocalin-like domain-containing protein [Nannocystaceae bacterium]|nr:lipocalin-like domain-containing protein [bacterium]